LGFRIKGSGFRVWVRFRAKESEVRCKGLGWKPL